MTEETLKKAKELDKTILRYEDYLKRCSKISSINLITNDCGGMYITETIILKPAINNIKRIIEDLLKKAKQELSSL